MRITEIRQQLNNYIDSAEDKKLKAIYIILENEMVDDYKLTQDQKDELDKRFADHQNGIGKTYTCDETVTMAEQATNQK